MNAGTNAFSEFTHAIDQPLEPSFNDFSSSLVVPITFGALDRPIGEVPGEVESQKGAHCTAMATVKDIPRQDSSALIIQTFPVEHLVSFDQQYMIDNTLDGPEPRAESSRAAQERQEPASTQPTSDGSQEQSVPVDPQDHISCDHAQCSGIRFSTMIDWT